MRRSAECEVWNAEWTMQHGRRTGLTPHSELRTPNLRGFTLLEVMVAVSIMAMVLVTLLGLKNRSMQDVALAERITTATMLANRLMTETVVMDTVASLKKSGQTLEDAGEFAEEEYKDYSWKKSVAPLQIPVGQIMEVRVAVLWKEGTREESVDLVSYE